jgi:protein gp37
MSDLFHEKVSFNHIERVFDVVKQAHHHTFQISVENRKYRLPRIDMLREIDATIRYEDHA